MAKYYRKKRRRYGRRKTRRYRRRSYRRKSRRGTVGGGRTYWYTRVFNTTLTCPGLSGGIPSFTGLGYSFKLSDLINYSEFTNLYDQYKLYSVIMVFRPRQNANYIGGNGGGRFQSVLDFDDAGSPAASSILNEYQSMKETSDLRVHTRYVKPCVSVPVYQVGATFGYSPARKWLDCANEAVPHYGIKVGVTNPSPDAIIYDIEVKYRVCFRNVR